VGRDRLGRFSAGAPDVACATFSIPTFHRRALRARRAGKLAFSVNRQPVAHTCGTCLGTLPHTGVAASILLDMVAGGQALTPLPATALPPPATTRIPRYTRRTCTTATTAWL